jgi:hypothetical protein
MKKIQLAYRSCKSFHLDPTTTAEGTAGLMISVMALGLQLQKLFHAW